MSSSQEADRHAASCADDWSPQALLEGPDPIADSPAAAAALARMIEDVTAPARPGELDGLEAALTAFNGAQQAKRKAATRGRRGAAIGLGALVAILASGAGAAYANVLPSPLQKLAHHTIGAPAPTPTVVTPGSEDGGVSDPSRVGGPGAGLLGPVGRPLPGAPGFVPGATNGPGASPLATDAPGVGVGTGSTGDSSGSQGGSSGNQGNASGNQGNGGAGVGNTTAPGQSKKTTGDQSATGNGQTKPKPTGGSTAAPGQPNGTAQPRNTALPTPQSQGKNTAQPKNTAKPVPKTTAQGKPTVE